MSTGDHIIVCLVHSSHFISHYVELIETVTHPDPWIYKSSHNDSVSQFRNGRKFLFGEVSVWTSVCCNIKQQKCSVVDLINAFKCCGASHSDPLHVRATQLNFFCTFNTTDLEGRGREQDGPHHTTLRPGSSGACASHWGRCWRSLSSCLWGWDCCSRWPGTLDFHRPCEPKILSLVLWSEFEPFWGRKWVGWASTQDSKKCKTEAKGSPNPLNFLL